MQLNAIKVWLTQCFWFLRRQKKPSTLPIKKTTLEDIESFYATHPLAPERAIKIDGITWNDLNMTPLFTKLAACYTTAGQHWLFAALHHTLYQKEDLEKRHATLKSLTDLQSSNPRLFTEIEASLYRIGATKTNTLNQLDHHMQSNTVLLILVTCLRYLWQGALVYTLISYTAMPLPFHHLSLTVTLLISGLNILVHYGISSRIGEQIKALSYISCLLGSASKIEELIEPVLPQHSEQLLGVSKNLKTLIRQSKGAMDLAGGMVEVEYMKILMLSKTISYLKSAGTLQGKAADVHHLYSLIGEIDGLMAIARHHHAAPLCYPSFSSVESERLGTISGLRVEAIYHPLLESPVCNDIELNQSIIITGSNMSGKSTFLRALAISALCSQTICTAFAKRYTSVPFSIISSISLNDHISEGKSYYLAEAQGILRMLQSPKLPGVQNLFFIDEIFKGTNANERVIAATEILNQLEAQGALVAVTTHDLQILENLDDYQSYHFTENVTEEAMTFSYKIHSGKSHTQNAIKILAYLKYPKELILRMTERG